MLFEWARSMYVLKLDFDDCLNLLGWMQLCVLQKQDLFEPTFSVPQCSKLSNLFVLLNWKSFVLFWKIPVDVLSLNSWTQVWLSPFLFLAYLENKFDQYSWERKAAMRQGNPQNIPAFYDSSRICRVPLFRCSFLAWVRVSWLVLEATFRIRLTLTARESA